MAVVKNLFLLLSLSCLFNLAQAESNTKPDYHFEELKSVSSIRASDVNGWGRINDQVLVTGRTASRKYILVLARPDHDLAFSTALGVTSNAGRVAVKFDEVYAGNSTIRVGNRIMMIYEVKGSDAMKHARALFELRDCESQKNADCSSFTKAVEDTTVPAPKQGAAQ
ncbi:DUF6491 family protein [Simiduia curdlanivorans]|uniref:DUF6491 family protein n=1 Tax=Simiduia curdlanivorans TaxID=1492769 RepID=A0ABV8V0D4_9GAMM|nr:DUF6491 family protein [Simiduia curdlanivorans]MDN3640497.1 DUF6491 family protein [Simiduia curdlanivorans]